LYGKTGAKKRSKINDRQSRDREGFFVHPTGAIFGHTAVGA
jgi:hypothetical protein